jgi:sarcosine oxidase subunit alpha
VAAAALVSARRRERGRRGQPRSAQRAHNAGVVDVSTLGKIELAGRDVVAFLDRVLRQRLATLGVGRCRYGVMLRDDGMVMDDGTVTRLAESHFLVTTTTVNAVRVMQHFEYLLQVVWPELDVLRRVGHGAVGAPRHRGPRCARRRGRLVDIDVSNERFRFLAFAPCRVGRCPRACSASATRASSPTSFMCRPTAGWRCGKRS